MKKNILIIMLILITTFILSACTTSNIDLNEIKADTETINATEKIEEPESEITTGNEKPDTENIKENNFSRSTYYNGEEWCTENGV